MRAREAAGQVPRVPRGPLNGVGGGAVGQEQARGAWESAAAGGEQRGRQRQRVSPPQRGGSKCEHNSRRPYGVGTGARTAGPVPGRGHLPA